MEPKAFRGCRTTALVTLAGAAFCEIAAVIFGGEAPHGIVLAATASPVGMSAFAIFVIMAKPEERTVAFRLILAIVPVAFIVLWAMGAGALTAGTAAGALIPAIIFAYLAFRATRESGGERRRTLDLLAATSIIGVSALSMVFFLDLSTRHFNPIFDSRYVEIDELFGAQPSAVIALIFRHVPALTWLCLAVYMLLPVAQAIVAALEARSPHNGLRLGMLPAFIITAAIGYVLYILMPAVGPAEYFGDAFPMLHVGSEYLAGRSNIDLTPGHLRGAMPSLHITWAVLLYLTARGLGRPAQILAGVFLFLTFLATLGLGMHYLIDLIVAAPLILLVRALCATDLSWQRSERALGIVGGVAILAVWIAITHAGFDIAANRIALFAAIAVTLALPSYLAIRLDRASSEALPGFVAVPA